MIPLKNSLQNLNMKDWKGRPILYGYSVQGEIHIKNNLPNQDAYLLKKFSFGSLVIVADGMGSKPFSDFGSQMVCQATCDAVQYWHKNHSDNIKHLLMILQTMWTALVSTKHIDSDCSSTALFAVNLKYGSLITAQLGDGIILLKKKEEVINLSKKRDGFVNQTHALGSTWDIDKWIFNKFDKLSGIEGVILATDGVSDDLLEDKFFDFSEYVLNIGNHSPQKRWRIIKKDLKNWKTPLSYDDKTIGVLKFNEEN